MNDSHETLESAPAATELCSKDDYCGNDASWDYFSTSNEQSAVVEFVRPVAALCESDASLDYASSPRESKTLVSVPQDATAASRIPAPRLRYDGQRAIADDGSWDYAPHPNAFGLAS